MNLWLSAKEIKKNYKVGLNTLLKYSARGNLPMKNQQNGGTLFSVYHVAKLFPKRHQSMGMTIIPPRLGVTRLGGCNTESLRTTSVKTARPTYARHPAPTKVAC
ncbi:MAG: hypothetical protein VYA34_08570 [Myxococcota bacterium]|nr:hypothetical protein [Myxococcota bacterium]